MDMPEDGQGQAGGRFAKGHKLGGRPKGSVSKATTEVRAFIRTVLEGAEYRQRLYSDLVERKVSPAVELMLWERCYGATPKVVDLTVSDPSQLDTGTLLARMRAIAAAIEPADIIESTYDDAGQTDSENPAGAPTGSKVIPE